MRRPARRMLALALASAALAAAGARALGQSSRETTPTPAGTSGATPEMLPEVLIDAVIAPVIAAQGGPTWQPLPALTSDARAALAGSASGVEPETSDASPGDPARPAARNSARPEASPEVHIDPSPAIDAALHGDPAMGCFVLALRLGSGSVALHHALREALSRPGRDAAWPALSVSDWTTTMVPAPADETALPAGARSSFAFTTEAVQGEVRVLSRGLQPPADTLAVACFFNAREPARAARLCQRMLPALEAALSTIPAPRPVTIPETSP